MGLMPLEQAKAKVLGRIAVLAPVEVPADEALGLITAEDVVSPEPIPAWDNTAMDGFAVRAADTAGAGEDAPVVLEVVATLPAGHRPDVPVGPGQAVRIMTGAPIPPGADAVVQVEATEIVAGGNSEASESESVSIFQQVDPGTHLRRAGEDLQPGQLAIPAGTCLTPAHLGVLFSIGATAIAAHPRPKVAVFSTGDELVPPGQPLEIGQIRDSNRISIISLLRQLHIEAVNGGVIADNEAAIETAFRDHASTCDAIITTGGVSMGDFDYVKVVLDRIGEMDWMQVAIRPAKPLAFGTIGGTPVFGLPGNPVSCMVSFELFARPALLKLAGHTEPQLEKPRLQAVAAAPLPRRPDGKTHFARINWSYAGGQYQVRPLSGQGSHQLSAMAAANGLAILPDSNGVAEGETIEFIQLGT